MIYYLFNSVVSLLAICCCAVRHKPRCHRGGTRVCHDREECVFPVGQPHVLGFPDEVGHDRTRRMAEYHDWNNIGNKCLECIELRTKIGG